MRRDTSYKTAVGACLSVVAVVVVSAFVYGQFSMVFDSSSPTVRDVVEYDAEKSFIDLVDQNIAPFFGFFNVSSGLMLATQQIQKLVTVKGTLIDNYIDLGTAQQKYIETEVPPIPCASLTNRRPY